ncbi:MAG: hypothetical protein ABUK19_07975, partial [Desulfobacteria bacterium]
SHRPYLEGETVAGGCGGEITQRAKRIAHSISRRERREKRERRERDKTLIISNPFLAFLAFALSRVFRALNHGEAK